MKILITGGAGFIGHNLARRAVLSGHSIRVLDDLSTGFAENLEGLEVDLRHASLLDEPAVKSALAGIEAVVHLGALGSVPRSVADPLATHHANATGTLILIDQARKNGSPHIISASSSSVYGMNPALPKAERDWTRPMSPYAVSKLATEQYTLSAQQAFGLDTLAFRFFNVFGPGQRAGHAYAAVIPTWLDAAMRGEPIWINGDGLTSRDFTYVETVANVLLEACERRVVDPEPVNLAFGTNTTLLELVGKLDKYFDGELDVRFREPRPGDVPHSQADGHRLHKLFPTVQATELDQGLSETVTWFQTSRSASTRDSTV